MKRQECSLIQGATEAALQHFKQQVLAQRSTERQRSVVTIGNFDGLHLGHQNLIAELLGKAHQLKHASAVFTFDPHPVQFLYPERKIERLFPREDLAEMLENRGVENLIQFHFDDQFANLSPTQFLEDILTPLLNPSHLVIGHDFGFGKSKSGNLDFLRNYCRQHNWGLSVVEAFLLEEKVISSSRVRNALKDGDAAEARLLLGRPYYLRGQVFKGFQRGRTIGVPTANLRVTTEFVPRVGVYFTRAWVQGKSYKSITNVGYNPTFENSSLLKVETHIFDFNRDIYDQDLRVELLLFHRDEKKFAGLGELKAQLEVDFSAANEYFALNW